jgi:hypothetical protein
VAPDFSETSRWVGILSAASVAILLLAYAVILIGGLRSVRSRDEPISGRRFMILELLILAMSPAMVALMAAVHSWSPPDKKALSLIALVFMVLVAGITSTVHFAILTLSRQQAFADKSWHALAFEFRWPSVVYAIDILAWDTLFAFSMLFAAPVFAGSSLTLAIRVLMIVSGLLSLAGLSGVVANDMRLRNIGIVGYVAGFFVISVLLTVLFFQADPVADAEAVRRARATAVGSLPVATANESAV